MLEKKWYEFSKKKEKKRNDIYRIIVHGFVLIYLQYGITNFI